MTTNRRSLLKMLPTLLTFGLFEAKVMAEVGVKSPLDTVVERTPERLYQVRAVSLQDGCPIFTEEGDSLLYHDVATVLSEADAQPVVLAAFEELLSYGLVADEDLVPWLLDESHVPRSQPANQKFAALVQATAEWYWRVLQVRNPSIAAQFLVEISQMIEDDGVGLDAEALAGLVGCLGLPVPLEDQDECEQEPISPGLSEQELVDLRAILDPTDRWVCVVPISVTETSKEMWDVFVQKAQATREIVGKYQRSKQADTFFRFSQAAARKAVRKALTDEDKAPGQDEVEAHLRRHCSILFPIHSGDQARDAG